MNRTDIVSLIKSSSNYWEKRALEKKLNILDNEDDYLKRLKGIYDHAEKQIDEKMARVYARYGSENGLSLTQAYKKLPRDMEKNYKHDVMDYIEKAKSGDPQWRGYLLNQSLMHQHSVLEQLKTEYRAVVYNIDTENTGGKFLEKIYKNANYYAQYASNGEQFARVDQSKINRLLNEDWSGGGSFSENIWKNKQLLVNSLDDILIKGLATGDSYDKMSKELAKRMGTSFSNARRLIMTESARIANQGLLDHYNDTGVEQLLFVATLDNRTSEICRVMDGNIINIEDAQIGLNVPPMHPYCRSVISPYYEFNEVKDRMFRDGAGKNQKGRNRTYAEYVEEELGDIQQAEAIVSTRNDISTLIKATSVLSTPTILAASSSSFYNPDKAYVQKNMDMNQKIMDHYGINRDEVDNRVDNTLKPLIEESDIAIRATMDSLDSILEEGRIKSQFETKQSGTGFRPELRAEAENTLFGYPTNMDVALRPIYGYLTNIKSGFEFSKKNTAQMYGNVSIVMKSGIRDRTTFTVGDSLDGIYHWNNLIPNKITDPTYTSMNLGRMLTDEYSNYTGKIPNTLEGMSANIGYMEAQIHNGAGINDIEKVYISKSANTWRGKEALDIDNAQLNKLIRKLKKLNIDYEVVE